MNDFIIWWGAGLSTVLAVIRVWEFWKNRFRLEIGYSFTGHPEMGNDIYIRNLSDKPILLSHYELFYRSKYWPFRKDNFILSPEDMCDFTIQPHTSKTLNFSGVDNFSWGWKAMKGRKICIRLHIAGRKSLVKKVYE